MCVIVLQPTGSYISKEVAQACWKTNPDGGGFAFFNDEGMHIQKYMTFDEFWPAFEQARSLHRERDFLLHFRIATHGTVDVTNVHPFPVDDSTVLAHNGIISSVPDYKDGRSDTRVFIDEVIPELPDRWFANAYVRDMVGSWIGGSKFAILTPNSWHIVNEQKGVWDNGMWFSNMYHVKPKVTYSFPRKEKHPSEYVRPSKSAVDTMRFFSDQYIWEDDDISLAALVEDEITEATLDRIIDARERMGLGRYEVEFNPLTNEYECEGCVSKIDTSNNMCDCFESGCRDCLMLTAYCKCGQGLGPTTIIEMDELLKRREETPGWHQASARL